MNACSIVEPHQLKRRNPQLITICKQLKLTASDGKKYTDWSQIDKREYLTAMQESPVNSTHIYMLINGALTNEINNREIFMKGIDYSYYYDQIDRQVD